jgi:hypothetical protein
MIKGSSNKLTGLLSAGTPYVVSEDTIKQINNNQNIFNYTVSVWIYVDNWDITRGSNKPILNIPGALDIYLGRTENNLSVDIYPFSTTPDQNQSNMDSYSNMNPLEPAPIEGLTSMNHIAKKHAKENMQNLSGCPYEGFYGKVSTTANVKSSEKRKEGFSTNEKDKLRQRATVKYSEHHREGFRPYSSTNKFTSIVPSIPLQSWTNIAVSVHDKAIDIYINGKLTQSNLFPFVPAPVKNAMTLTPSPGFIGWTSNLQYHPNNLTPAQINNMYNSGYTGSAEGLLSLLGKYSMKIIFVDNTQTP